MRVLLLGASGRTGQQVLSTLLTTSPTTTITALVRNPTSLPPQDRLTITKGTPISQSDISNAISSAPSNDPVTAVIMTLAVPRTSESFFGKPTAEPGFLRSCVTAAMNAMREHGITRLVVLSMFGSGESWSQMAWPLKAVFRHTGMAVVLDEHNAVDAMLRGDEADGIEWTLVKPPMLKDGEGKDAQEFGEHGEGLGMMDSATRGTVAETLVKAAIEGKWMREAVVIANR